MGFDFFAAAKFVDGIKVEPTVTVHSEFPSIPADYFDFRFHQKRCCSPRFLMKMLYETGEEDLLERFYGDMKGERRFHADIAIEDMPDDLPDEMLPPLLSPEAALSLANDIAAIKHREVPETVEFLRFWGERGHPIHCSY